MWLTTPPPSPVPSPTPCPLPQFLRTVLTTQMFDVFLEERENAMKEGVTLDGHFEQKCRELKEAVLEPDQ